MGQFKLHAPYKPTGDQPQAIEHLVNGINAGMEHQVLLGVTGSGKTYAVANVIEQIDKPILVISHNKTLAAQLYQEYKEFFPNNAVEYFVSYYDYYQPEAYIPKTDTYIEKDADINEDIDKLRLAATTSLMTRNDVIVVSSVSCIYNLGSSLEYRRTTMSLAVGMPIRPDDIFIRLIQLYYVRSDYEFKRGTFRVNGDVIDIFPAYLNVAVRVEVMDNKIESLKFIHPLTGKAIRPEQVKNTDSENNQPDNSQTRELDLDEAERNRMDERLTEHEISQIKMAMEFGQFTLFPAKHYVASHEKTKKGMIQIEKDLQLRVAELKAQGKELEAHRLKQKTEYDLELLREIGYCKGIENYSRYFDGRKPGDPPFSLLDYFPDDYLIIIDESHITVPQIRGMYNGDQARKQTLIDYGFRLPSALDNRPLRFDEFLDAAGQIIYTSATPGEWELQKSQEAFLQLRSSRSELHEPNDQQRADQPPFQPFNYPMTGIVELLIRPTGLLDPEISVRGSKDQIDNLISEIIATVKKKQRVLVTTLTKRIAEDLTGFLREQGISVQYIHSDVDTLERVDILNDLRKGVYDVVVGINLLREGLDLPEVTLVAILDADKEGFLRSDKSLIQTMGRAARHVEGRVIMYADTITNSMQRAIDEVTRRRKIQLAYNKEHNITPTSISKPIREKIIENTKKDKPKNYERIKMDVDTLVSELAGDELLVSDSNTNQPANQLTSELVATLTKHMKQAAKELDFERAAVIRDRINELQDVPN